MKIKNVILLSTMILSNGCSYHDQYHGYNFDDKATVKQNASEQEVLNVMGTPTITSDYGDKTYYYIMIKQASNSFSHPKMIEQKVTEISFNTQNLVKEVKHYSINEAKDIDYVEYTTTLKGNEKNPVEQVINNIGRFNAIGDQKKKLD